MRIPRQGARRAATAVALAGVSAIALAACTTGGTASPSASSGGGTITIAEVNAATSFNYFTPQGNLDTNGFINYLTQPQFFTLDQNYDVVPNKDLGTYTKTSDNPLTVKYTLNKGDKWSDGEPMTADDLMLGWANVSCYYDSATLDDDGNVTSGTQYFATAAGCPFATGLPTVGDDNRSITFTYTDPYVDYELVSPIQFPAHVVAAEAGTTVADLMNAFKTTPKGDATSPAPANPIIQKVGAFINTGYDATSLPSDAKLLVSGGPLQVSAWDPGDSGSMTFSPNPQYTGDHKVKFSKLVMRFIGDASAQVTALQNGEVDAVQPQATADTVKALKGVSGVNVIQGSQTAYDHLDLNFGGTSTLKDANVRKAFLLTIPRDQIVDSIVKPINSKATPLNSQIFLPGQDGYDDSAKANGSSDYSKVDIDKAKQLLAGATPTVRILYNTNNPNRVDEFQAIQASAAKAGFKVQDAGSPQWSTLLAGGDYDASIFGWVNPGAGNAAIPQLFQTNNPGNYTKYNDKAASDLAVQTQTATDAKTLLSQKQQIDKLTFADAYGLPLFQSPGLFAVNSTLKGVKYFGGQTGMVWNVWDWSK